MGLPPIEDLPQMWQRPCSAVLTEILQGLEIKPPTWSHKRRPSEILEAQAALGAQKKGEVMRYLSSVIKSSLAWIDGEEQREAIWELASRRITERSGRSGMGNIVRSWPFENGGNGGDVEEGNIQANTNGDQPFELIIKEPALTGDSLGFKTWGSSYVLAQELPRLAATLLSRLLSDSLGDPKPGVLELGSGTGLLGLAAAALWRVPVALSDLPNIVPNLRNNADTNEDLIKARGGSLQVGPLTWGGNGDDQVDPELFGRPFQYKIVLAADPLYDDEHPVLLAAAIAQQLSLGPEARAVVMVPQRDESTKQLNRAFKSAMANLEPPLVCLTEEELAGQDDWVEDREEGRVKCWLGIFSRGK